MQKYRLQIIFVLIGAIFVILGLVLQKGLNLTDSKIEVLDNGATLSGQIKNGEIVVEVSGEVEKPGVYHLPVGSRVEDIFIMSGGITANADRNWVDKNINKAAKLTDGQKIYIPDQQSKVLSANVAQSNITSDKQSLSSISSLISINSASLSELDSLPGIGQVYGQKIIDHRPYSDVSELVSKKVIPQSIFDKLKDKISVY